MNIKELVLAKAKALGFALAGVAVDTPPEAAQFYEWWAEQGYAGHLQYLLRHQEKKRSITNILPGAKAAIVCALPFPGGNSTPPSAAAGKLARYASGLDYHDVLKEKLQLLATYLDELATPAQPSLAYVDTGAIQERALAASAGIGWLGKNAMLINPEWGSWFWLGEVITQVQLPADKPLSDHCGKCRKCLDACPTQAILEDKRAIDTRRCLSFWNIEHKGEIPEEFHKPMGDWLLGCDICQEVCPWTAHSIRRGRKELGPPGQEFLVLDELQALSEAEFRQRFKDRAIGRPKLAGLQRNAAIIKKNLE